MTALLVILYAVKCRLLFPRSVCLSRREKLLPSEEMVPLTRGRSRSHARLAGRLGKSGSAGEGPRDKARRESGSESRLCGHCFVYFEI